VKGRESVHPIAGAEDVQIVHRRLDTRPVEYAILLQVRRAKGWETGIVAGNFHVDRQVEEPRCHRYIEGERQPAEPLPFEASDVEDATARIIDWFAEHWTELVS